MNVSEPVSVEELLPVRTLKNREPLRVSLAGPRFWLGAITMGTVLTISWVLYFVVINAVGFDLGLTVGFVVVTVVMVALFAALEFFVRNKRARSAGEMRTRRGLTPSESFYRQWQGHNETWGPDSDAAERVRGVGFEPTNP